MKVCWNPSEKGGECKVHVIGAIILVLTTVAFTLYLGTAIVSFIDPDCPFRTPLTKVLAKIKAWLFNSKYVCDDGMMFCRLTTNSHCFAGNIRIKFTFMNSIKKLFERFGDPDSDVQKTALICITALCVHGIVFTKLPSSDSSFSR